MRGKQNGGRDSEEEGGKDGRREATNGESEGEKCERMEGEEGGSIKRGDVPSI